MKRATEVTSEATHEFAERSKGDDRCFRYDVSASSLYCDQPRSAAIHRTPAEPPNRFAQARKLLYDEYSFRPKDDEELVGFLIDRLRQVEAALTEVDNVVWKIRDSIAKVT